MVSRFPYYSFKKVNVGERVPFAYFLIVPGVFILIALNPPVMLFVFFSVYALSAPVLWLLRKARNRPRRIKI
jgi:CDP-diacylglycerol--serine O-phosphatidyltransferase